MRRSKRYVLRLSFLLVIFAGIFGGWYVDRAFTIQPETLVDVQLVDSGNWIDFFAALGEQALQLFLGFTSEQ